MPAYIQSLVSYLSGYNMHLFHTELVFIIDSA